jgi:ABC-type multidrug transport system fused ATPase/permease subunit
MSLYRIILRSLRVLNHSDQRKVVFVTGAQLSLSILDLIAVGIFGALGTIAVRGVQSRETSTFLDPILDSFGFGDLAFQAKVALLAGLAAFSLVLKTLLSMLITRRSLLFLSRRGAEISIKLIGQSIGIKGNDIGQQNSQENLYSLTTGVSNIALGVLGTSIALAADVSLVALIAITLFVVDWITASFTFLFFAAIGTSLYFSLHKRSSQLGRAQAHLTIANNQSILTLFKAYPEIFVRNTQRNFLEKIASQRNDLAKTSAETAFLPFVGKYVIEIAIVIGVLGLSLLQFVSQDAASASGTLAFFIVSATRLAPAILRLQHGAITINYSANASLKTLELIENLGQEGEKKLPNIQSGLSFVPKLEVKEMSFSFEKADSRLFSKANFDLVDGDFCAIVGPTGAGKSTLVKLLLGVMAPTEGEVLISGKDPRTAHSIWPGSIAYVPQEVFVMAGTLKENLLLGLDPRDFSDLLLEELLNDVHLKEFMKQRNMTLDSQIGEDGSNLSGGQRQRIGIARALLTKPHILILDEATSSLDGMTELEIGETLRTLESVKVKVVIAHRLSTIREANTLIYINDGELMRFNSINEARQQIPEFDKQAKLMGLN